MGSPSVATPDRSGASSSTQHLTAFMYLLYFSLMMAGNIAIVAGHKASGATGLDALLDPEDGEADPASSSGEGSNYLTDFVILGSTIAVTAPLMGLVARSLVWPPMKAFYRKWRRQLSQQRLQRRKKQKLAMLAHGNHQDSSGDRGSASGDSSSRPRTDSRDSKHDRKKDKLAQARRREEREAAQAKAEADRKAREARKLLLRQQKEQRRKQQELQRREAEEAANQQSAEDAAALERDRLKRIEKTRQKLEQEEAELRRKREEQKRQEEEARLRKQRKQREADERAAVAAAAAKEEAKSSKKQQKNLSQLPQESQQPKPMKKQKSKLAKQGAHSASRDVREVRKLSNAAQESASTNQSTNNTNQNNTNHHDRTTSSKTAGSGSGSTANARDKGGSRKRSSTNTSNNGNAPRTTDVSGSKSKGSAKKPQGDGSRDAVGAASVKHQQSPGTSTSTNRLDSRGSGTSHARNSRVQESSSSGTSGAVSKRVAQSTSSGPSPSNASKGSTSTGSAVATQQLKAVLGVSSTSSVTANDPSFAAPAAPGPLKPRGVASVVGSDSTHLPGTRKSTFSSATSTSSNRSNVIPQSVRPMSFAAASGSKTSPSKNRRELPLSASSAAQKNSKAATQLSGEEVRMLELQYEEIDRRRWGEVAVSTVVMLPLMAWQYMNVWTTSSFTNVPHHHHRQHHAPHHVTNGHHSHRIRSAGKHDTSGASLSAHRPWRPGERRHVSGIKSAGNHPGMQILGSSAAANTNVPQDALAAASMMHPFSGGSSVVDSLSASAGVAPPGSVGVAPGSRSRGSSASGGSNLLSVVGVRPSSADGHSDAGTSTSSSPGSVVASSTSTSLAGLRAHPAHGSQASNDMYGSGNVGKTRPLLGEIGEHHSHGLHQPQPQEPGSPDMGPRSFLPSFLQDDAAGDDGEAGGMFGPGARNNDGASPRHRANSPHAAGINEPWDVAIEQQLLGSDFSMHLDMDEPGDHHSGSATFLF
eukprot:INCI1143.1.p1 GENE.INCI1143.1~~INCI1143.1.p1  ORF type:complete len:1054 (+),score=183.22 INCI1143.1:212-3163(+)